MLQDIEASSKLKCRAEHVRATFMQVPEGIVRFGGSAARQVPVGSRDEYESILRGR